MNTRDQFIVDVKEELPALMTHSICRVVASRFSHNEDSVVAETPVALVYNGISHAVMLATPNDLEDFALGFSLSEEIIARPSDLREIEIVVSEQGIELRITISEMAFQGLKVVRRQLAGRTGCGLCGKESLEQVIRSVPFVKNRLSISPLALERAAEQLPWQQPLHRTTGGAHAAAWANEVGEILFVREDVGRHNALDKLLGVLYKKRIDTSSGFVILSSRASYELVLKAAHAGIELLATVSAPSSLAIRNAEKSGMTLIGWLRGNGFSMFTSPSRVNWTVKKAEIIPMNSTK